MHAHPCAALDMAFSEGIDKCCTPQVGEARIGRLKGIDQSPFVIGKG